MSRFAGIGNSEIDPFLYFIKKRLSEFVYNLFSF
jgi:hypothetical protein